MDEKKVNALLPNYYTLVSKYTLPNVELISLSTVFRHLPFKPWYALNKMLGKVRKGYWIMLMYRKRQSANILEFKDNE